MRAERYATPGADEDGLDDQEDVLGLRGEAGEAGDPDEIEVEVTDYTVLPAGVYPVEFLAFERLQSDYGPAITLQYRVTDGPHIDALVDEICSLKGGKGSKLRERLDVLRGRPHVAGELLRPGALLGAVALAHVTVKQAVGDNGEFDVNRVHALTPTAGSRNGTSAAGAAMPTPAVDPLESSPF